MRKYKESQQSDAWTKKKRRRQQRVLHTRVKVVHGEHMQGRMVLTEAGSDRVDHGWSGGAECSRSNFQVTDQKERIKNEKEK
jgi:hypothetical protein